MKRILMIEVLKVEFFNLIDYNHEWIDSHLVYSTTYSPNQARRKRVNSSSSSSSSSAVML